MIRPNESCVFVYLYRDAGNYKTGAQLLLDGSYTVSAESTIHDCCYTWYQFVAEQVAIPPLYAELYQYSNGPTIDDVAFHEFTKLRPATQEDYAELVRWGTLDDLIKRFRSVRYWDCRLSPHCW